MNEDSRLENDDAGLGVADDRGRPAVPGLGRREVVVYCGAAMCSGSGDRSLCLLLLLLLLRLRLALVLAGVAVAVTMITVEKREILVNAALVGTPRAAIAARGDDGRVRANLVAGREKVADR